MEHRRTNILAGGILVAIPVGFLLLFGALQGFFHGYPEILRAPVPEILSAFRAGGQNLIAIWYGLFLLAMLFVPASILTRRALGRDDALGDGLVVSGILAGLFQALGLARWVFVVPSLLKLHDAPNASEAQRLASEAVFLGFHRFFGSLVGEHLGYLATGAFTLCFALGLTKSGRAGSWFAWTGGAIALGMWIGLLEPLVGPAVLPGVSITYCVWACWLVYGGIRLSKGG